MRRLILAPWVLFLALAPGCVFSGAEDEPKEGAVPEGDDRVGVVGEDGPFDPAAAVDDEDGEGQGDAGADEAQATPEADPAEEKSAAAEEPTAARKREKEAAVDAAEKAGGDDDEAKAELAQNPPAEPTPEGESAAWTAADVALDGAVLAAAALVLALLVVFGPAHKRAAAGAVALAAAVLFFLWRQGG